MRVLDLAELDLKAMKIVKMYALVWGGRETCDPGNPERFKESHCRRKSPKMTITDCTVCLSEFT